MLEIRGPSPLSILYETRLGIASLDESDYNTSKRLYSTMEWTAPQFEEVCLSCEIARYANAEI